VRQCCFAASFAHHLFPCSQLFCRVFCFHHTPHLPAVSSEFVPRACITFLLNRSRINCAAVRHGPALLYVLLIARGPALFMTLTCKTGRWCCSCASARLGRWWWRRWWVRTAERLWCRLRAERLRRGLWPPPGHLPSRFEARVVHAKPALAKSSPYISTCQRA